MKAIVTGATKGIGLAITRALLDDGAQVYALGRDMTLLENLPDYTGRLHLHTADLTNTDLTALVHTAAKKMGGIDVLVNNAGITLAKNLEETGTEEWDRLMNLNARVPYVLSQAVIPYLKKHPRSHIIQIASVVASKGCAGQSAYVASKHALLGFSKSIAKELQPYGIRVHVISPGGVATDMVSSVRPDIDTQELIHPQEIADIIRFLLAQRGNAVIDEIQVRRETKAPFA
ncbi:MAG: SDR family oxidoreductase [Sphaerochaetaceae bacterium]|nr:SDR family oxidoreductase [Sphaerochaetaceae bacterium]